MKRTATFAILFLLTASSAPGAAPQPKDPEPFFVAFSPDGGRIVVALRRGGVKVLSVPDLKEIRSFPVQDDQPVTSAAVSPSGRWLAIDQDGKDLRIWNLETGQAQLTASTGSASPVYLFSPDDAFIVFQKGTLQVWDVKAAQKRRAVDAANIQRMAVSPDGRHLAASGMAGGICLVGQFSKDICLYAIDEMKVVAGTALKPFSPNASLDVPDIKLRDIAFLSDGRIAILVGYRTLYLAPDNLLLLDLKDTVQQLRIAGIRSTPHEPVVEAESEDGQWKVTASVLLKRLYLYRQVPRGLALEKFVTLP